RQQRAKLGCREVQLLLNQRRRGGKIAAIDVVDEERRGDQEHESLRTARSARCIGSHRAKSPAPREWQLAQASACQLLKHSAPTCVLARTLCGPPRLFRYDDRPYRGGLPWHHLRSSTRLIFTAYARC